MRIGWTVCLLLVACRIELDSTPRLAAGAQTCMVDTSSSKCVAVQPMLASLQVNMFTPNCAISGCHDGGHSAAGKIDLRDGMSYAHLVNATSDLEPTRKLVVPGDPAASYLLVMIGKIAPADAEPPAPPVRADVGLMPQDNGGKLLCCQKLDAVEMWIADGAGS